VGQIAFTNGGTLRMMTTKQYDFFNRLLSLSSSNSVLPAPVSYSCTYNNANQRIRVGLADITFWLYRYFFKSGLLAMPAQLLP
jgi:hypothetical protein